jgi:hypothetical protein
MTKPKDRPPLVGDVEIARPPVAECLGDESGANPMTVRLADLWSDFIRVADEAHDLSAPRKTASALPLLDEMRGILQWD